MLTVWTLKEASTVSAEMDMLGVALAAQVSVHSSFILFCLLKEKRSKIQVV